MRQERDMWQDHAVQTSRAHFITLQLSIADSVRATNIGGALERKSDRHVWATRRQSNQVCFGSMQFLL